MQRQRPVEHRAAVLDLGRVPERVVLVVQQHQVVAPEPCLAPGVEQQHQRQQPLHLGLVRHQFGQCTAQPDRLGGQVAAASVALVEDQVDDCQHRVQAFR